MNSNLKSKPSKLNASKKSNCQHLSQKWRRSSSPVDKPLKKGSESSFKNRERCSFSCVSRRKRRNNFKKRRERRKRKCYLLRNNTKIFRKRSMICEIS